MRTLLSTRNEKVVRNNGKQLDHLDEMNKILETQKLPKLTQEEIENLNRPILTGKEIGSIIQNVPTRKIQEEMTSLLNSTKYLEKN